MDRIKRDTLLGLVFFCTLALLLWATVNLTDLSLGRIAPLTVYFPEAGGLRTGDPVLVLGKGIGKVGDVQLRLERRDHRVEIVLLLQEEVALATDYSIQIQESSVLGGRQVQIDPGIGAPRRETEGLRGTSTGNPLQSLGGFFEGKGASGEQLNLALVELHRFLQNLNDPDTSIGALVRRRDLYDEVLGTVQSLRRVFQAVEEGQGILGRVIKDTTLRDDTMRLLTNLAAVSDQLRSTDGMIGRLLNDRDLAIRFTAIFEDLNVMIADAKDGKGPVGRLLRDEQMATDLALAMANLNDLLRKANDPEAGALGRVLADAEMGTALKSAVLNLRDITDKINAGDGVLAVLLNDRELGVRLRRVFTQVSRALEDAREAAPIGNFVQVLTGAF